MNRIKAAILRFFPRIPSEDLIEVLAEYQRANLIVPRCLQFRNVEETYSPIDAIAHDAVRAHIPYQPCNSLEIFGNFSLPDYLSKPGRRAPSSDLLNSIEKNPGKWKKVD